MPVDYVAINEMKRKLRAFKRHEIRIRFGDTPHQKRGSVSLVWNEFFDLKNTNPPKAKYSIGELISMSKEEFKDVVNEYFFKVYYRYYQENGMVKVAFYDPEILAEMGLPPFAGYDDIKKRFRELAKKYHPDTGGDNEKFIKLMENYQKLIEKH